MFRPLIRVGNVGAYSTKRHLQVKRVRIYCYTRNESREKKPFNFYTDFSILRSKNNFIMETDFVSNSPPQMERSITPQMDRSITPRMERSITPCSPSSPSFPSPSSPPSHYQTLIPASPSQSASYPSSSSSAFLSVRIVNADYYLSAPLSGIDPTNSVFRLARNTRYMTRSERV